MHLSLVVPVHIYTMQAGDSVEASYMCDLCQAQLALYLCVCVHPAPRICAACQRDHVFKALNSFHSLVPISLQTHVLTYEDVSSARLKLLKLQEAEGEVRTSAKEVDKCIAEMHLRAEELITALRLYVDQERTILEQWKSELTNGLERSVEEAKELLLSQGSEGKNKLTSLLVRKAQGRFLASERLFEWIPSATQWNLSTYLGVQWRTVQLEQTAIDEEMLTEVEAVSDLNAYKRVCVERLQTLYPASVAESKVASQSQTLEAKFYREQYTALRSCIEVLDILRPEDLPRLPQSVENCFRSLCGCKSQKLIFAYSQKTIEIASKLVNLDGNMQIQPQPQMIPSQSVSFSLLPLIIPGGLKLYSLPSNTAVTFPLPDVVKLDAFTVLISTQSRLILCGGGTVEVWKSVYSLVPPDGVAAGRDMLERRRLHGAVAYEEDVYVFGGSNGRLLRTCEYYHNKEWTALPNMTEARYGLNPALYNGCIYVVGGEKAKGAEILTIASLSFAYIALALPEHTQTCSIVLNDCLIVISKTKTAKWALNSLSSPPEVLSHQPLHPYSNFPPVKYQDHIYVLLQQCGNCVPGDPLKAWDLDALRCLSVVVPA